MQILHLWDDLPRLDSKESHYCELFFFGPLQKKKNLGGGGGGFIIANWTLLYLVIFPATNLHELHETWTAGSQNTGIWSRLLDGALHRHSRRAGLRTLRGWWYLQQWSWQWAGLCTFDVHMLYNIIVLHFFQYVSIRLNTWIPLLQISEYSSLNLHQIQSHRAENRLDLLFFVAVFIIRNAKHFRQNLPSWSRRLWHGDNKSGTIHGILHIQLVTSEHTWNSFWSKAWWKIVPCWITTILL